MCVCVIDCSYLHKVWCGVEAAEVADLCVALGAGVVVGRLTGSNIKFSLTQRALNFGHLAHRLDLLQWRLLLRRHLLMMRR